MNLKQLTQLTEDQARALFEEIRWPDGPVCVHCASTNIARMTSKSARPGLMRCKSCRKQFTVSVGTIFEDSHIPFRTWLMAFHMVCSSKKGVSAHQLHRNLGVTYKTAWFMAHRIREAMKVGSTGTMLRGTVEVDETYVGGKIHRRKPAKTFRQPMGRSLDHKTPVVALLERHGPMRVRVVQRVTAKELKGAIRENVNRASTIMTDQWPSYRGIGKEYDGGHKVVNHSKGEYVRGDAYTNTAESYFALLKRGLHGTFHHLSKEHLQRYCDEFAFRWNHRSNSDGDRTIAALRTAEGKRLRYQ
jgi:transposase-like protein